jgi:predicted nucleotidyltransferase
MKLNSRYTDAVPLTKVVVGSRLHGLESSTSDWDYRGIHMHSLKAIISPFQNLKNTTWFEGDTDNTSYELAEFCRLATQGNATILEVLFSDMIEETTPIADVMRENALRFVDTDRFVSASRGYAHSQLVKLKDFAAVPENSGDRSAKFAVSYARVMWQCLEFLKTGEFRCRIAEPLRSRLLDVKYHWDKRMVPSLLQLFDELEADVDREWEFATKHKPDLPWVEDFLLSAYTDDIDSLLDVDTCAPVWSDQDWGSRTTCAR